MAIALKGVDGALTDTDTPDYDVLYTCPVGKQAWVKSIVVANIDLANPHQFDIFRTVVGGTATVLNDVDQTLAAGKCSANVAGYALVAGDKLQGWADADFIATFAISIIEIDV
jgi:hypothetical protein